MVLIAYGIFLLTFHLMGGSIVLDNKPNVMVFGGRLTDLRLYLWPDLGVAGTESLGMRWTRLKVTTFEGFAPDKRQRIVRLFGSALSICT